MQRSFTLVELMIVVAIISVLGAIAIPNFQQMQLKAKFAEAPVVLAGALDACQTLHMEQVLTNLEWGPNPAVPSKSPQDWLFGTSDGWGMSAYSPDGQVRCSYSGSSGFHGAALQGVCDIDGNGDLAVVYQQTLASCLPNGTGWFTGPTSYAHCTGGGARAGQDCY